jgi:hypothetical protein
VAHFFALGFEVALEGGFAGNGRGDALGDGDAGGFEGRDFLGVVGDEADGFHAEMFEDFGGEFEASIVGGVAELVVGFDGVEALVLELVGAELGHEADAAALLLLVEQDAGAFGGDHGEGEVELVVAVAAQGMEDVAGEALGVDADERGRSIRSGGEVAHDEGYGGFDGLVRRGAGFGEAFEAEDAECAPAGGEVGIGDLADCNEGHDCIIDSPGEGRIQWPPARAKAPHPANAGLFTSVGECGE